MTIDWTNDKALQEEKAASIASAQNLLNAAKSESRELTEDEQSAYDKAVVNAKRVNKLIDEAGVLNSLNANANIGRDAQPGAPGSDAPLVNRITIPAQYNYRHAQLKAFKGSDAEKAAYITGRFLLASIFKHEASREWCRDHGVSTVRSAMSVGTNSGGGFLVPSEMERAIIDLRESYGVARQYCQQVPMTSDTKDHPKRAGGVTAYHVGENTAVTDSDKTWSNVQLVAKKIGVLCKYSSEISEDSIISLADDLTQEIAYAFAVQEDTDLFVGDGTSTYGGINGLIAALNAGAFYTAASGNTAFSTLDLADFEGMVGKLADYPGIQPVWFIHKQGYAASISRLQNAAGGNTTQDLGNGPEKVFLGFPVQYVNVMNSTLTAQSATKGLCYLGDLRMGVAFGNRRGLTIKVSEDRFLENDQIAILGTERVDIQVHEAGTASAAGAIVGLLTP